MAKPYVLVITGRSRMETVLDTSPTARKGPDGFAWKQVKDESPLRIQYLSPRAAHVEAKNLEGLLQSNPKAVVTFPAVEGVSKSLPLGEWIEFTKTNPAPGHNELLVFGKEIAADPKALAEVRAEGRDSELKADVVTDGDGLRVAIPRKAEVTLLDPDEDNR